MNVIFKARSTNGRWGVDIVSATYTEKDVWPYQGRITDLGEIDNIRVFRVEKDPSAKSWLVLADEIVSGGTVLEKMSLQNGEITVGVIGPVAVVRDYGYKRRSSRTYLIREGKRVDLSSSQLLALGLIDGMEEKPAPDPKPLNSALADALKMAGLC